MSKSFELMSLTFLLSKQNRPARGRKGEALVFCFRCVSERVGLPVHHSFLKRRRRKRDRVPFLLPKFLVFKRSSLLSVHNETLASQKINRPRLKMLFGENQPDVYMVVVHEDWKRRRKVF